MRKSVQPGRFERDILVIVSGLVFCWLLLNQVQLSTAIAAESTQADRDWPRVPQRSPQAQSLKPLWQDVDERELQRRNNVSNRYIIPYQYRVLTVDLQELDQRLDQAPFEGSAQSRNSTTIIPLPLPNGEIQAFKIEAYALLAPDLAQKRSDISTYLGWGVDDPSATIRLDRTPRGFHGMILAADGISYIDPYSRGDTSTYISYYRRDYDNIWDKQYIESAIEKGEIDLSELAWPWPDAAAPRTSASPTDSGPIRRTYRLAVAATGEYTQFQAGPGDSDAQAIAAAQAAIVTTINRVNGIYERDVAVRLQLIDNTAIIYPDGGTDPYANSSGGLMLNQNQSNLDTVVGSGNYDIGHVFSTGGGGIAGLGVVCFTGSKAKGVTGSNSPVGDAFDVDFVAHEIGHQFAAEHTFNATGDPGSSSCTSTTRSANTAYEPGSGSTIMAYAGICTNQNLQLNSDDYFHGTSLDQISSFVANPLTGGSCAQTTPTGNLAPVVNAGGNFTIPKQTPFMLIGSATDVPEQTLTYNWEQFDLGTAWNAIANAFLPNADTDAPRPIFRSMGPSASSSRTFPSLNSILDDTYQNSGESLSNRNRTMQFRLTARDQLGGTSSDAAQITVDATAGPFRVTEPAATTIWPPDSTQTVQWNVANTAGGAVNCANVDILLSDDGGQTFPTTLVADTPNDGAQAVMMPHDGISAMRVKVVCSDNIFFDISASGAIVGLALFNDDHEGPNNWTTIVESGSNDWVLQTGNSFSPDNHWFIENISTESDSALQSPLIEVTTTDLFVRFFHRYDLEALNVPNSSVAYDGGVVEANINGGGWTYVENSLFRQNGYNKTMASTTPVIANKEAFSGNSGTTYQESIIELSSLVNVGDTVQIRFREVNDFSQAATGWFVDDVTFYSTQALPTVNLSVVKTASEAMIDAGDTLTYTIVATNIGSLLAFDIVITDTLPLSTTLVGNDFATGSTFLLPGEPSTITWTTGISLAQNEAVTYTFAIAVDADYPLTQVTNTAYVSATNASQSFASNETVTIVIGDQIYLPVIRK